MSRLRPEEPIIPSNQLRFEASMVNAVADQMGVIRPDASDVHSKYVAYTNELAVTVSKPVGRDALFPDLVLDRRLNPGDKMALRRERVAEHLAIVLGDGNPVVKLRKAAELYDVAPGHVRETLGNIFRRLGVVKLNRPELTIGTRENIPLDQLWPQPGVVLKKPTPPITATEPKQDPNVLRLTPSNAVFHLNKAINQTLQDREREVVTRLLGFHTSGPQTYQKIAKDLNLPRDDLIKLGAEALSKLRREYGPLLDIFLTELRPYDDMLD